MLTVTEAACSRLAQKLANAKAADDDATIRVVRKPKRKGRAWGIRLDKERPGDVAFAHQGRAVLVADEKISQLLANKTLDVQHGEAGPKLKLR